MLRVLTLTLTLALAHEACKCLVVGGAAADLKGGKDSVRSVYIQRRKDE